MEQEKLKEENNNRECDESIFEECQPLCEPVEIELDEIISDNSEHCSDCESLLEITSNSSDKRTEVKSVNLRSFLEKSNSINW